ncbi:MAG: hypothetical protein J5891_08105 [Spirochaetales bacterium]|nr:hypothetical protein [Spirochaetales bacterium]
MAAATAYASDPRLSAMGDAGAGFSGADMQSYPNPAAVFFNESSFTFAVRGMVSDTLGSGRVPFLPYSDLNVMFVADLITMGIDVSFESVNPNEKEDGHRVDLIQHTTLNVNLGAGYRFFSVGVGITGGSLRQRLDVPMGRLWDFPVQSVFAPFDRVFNSEFIQVDAGMMLRFGQFSVGVLLDDVLDNSGAQTTITWGSLFFGTKTGVYWSREEYSSRGKANSFIYSFAFEADIDYLKDYRRFDILLKAGAELSYRLVRDSSVSFRMGYKAMQYDLQGGIITTGLGLSIRKLEFALNATIPLQESEHLSVSAYMTMLF